MSIGTLTRYMSRDCNFDNAQPHMTTHNRWLSSHYQRRVRVNTIIRNLFYASSYFGDGLTESKKLSFIS